MSLPGDKRRIEWDRGSAEVWALSGAIHRLELALPDGRPIRPLAEAPWQGENETTSDATIPAHLRFLGGEWPCVPFGRTDIDPVAHGYGTDNVWAFGSGAGDIEGDKTATPTTDPFPQGGGGHEVTEINLSIAYPSNHPIARLTRTIRGAAGEARVDFALTVEARAACTLPVGLHPILALGKPGEVVRVDGIFGNGETFPIVFEPGVSRLAPAARFSAMAALPLAAGGAVSFGALLNETTEEAFQLFGVDGALRVAFPDSGYAVRLNWNPVDFPTCLFWLSTGGRLNKPWNGRFRGFGVEPLNAGFAEKNGAGVIAGGRSFLAGESWTTHYALAIEPL